jgi:2-aminoadipate transaminase
VGGRATWTVPEGGFFTWLELPDGDARTIAASALDEGVAVVPGPPFFSAGGGERNIRLSYSQASPEGIEDGIARLGPLLTR